MFITLNSLLRGRLQKEPMYMTVKNMKKLEKNGRNKPYSWAKYPNSAIQFINKDMNIAFK